MAAHSSVLAWRIPGTGEPGGLPSMGSYRVGPYWHDLAAAAAACSEEFRRMNITNTAAGRDTHTHTHIHDRWGGWKRGVGSWRIKKNTQVGGMYAELWGRSKIPDKLRRKDIAEWENSINGRRRGWGMLRERSAGPEKQYRVKSRESGFKSNYTKPWKPHWEVWHLRGEE